MIVVKLMGGLGNQLFQYAFGKAYAEKNKVMVRFDRDAYSVEGSKKFITKRKYALDCFNISQDKFFSYTNFKGNKIISSIFKSLSFKEISEASFAFSEENLKNGQNIVFEGYWQSEKYFKNIEDVIRKEFTLKKEFSIDNLALIREIKQKNSVSLHIRRGDYVNNSNTNKFHGTCPVEYYLKAIEIIAKKINAPHFYIFSDDTCWFENNIKLQFPFTIVSDGELHDYEELMVMSHCKHNIIANSSFSWWGAWLNNNVEKIVIAPSQWFAEKTINVTTLIPDDWIKLETKLVVNNE